MKVLEQFQQVYEQEMTTKPPSFWRRGTNRRGVGVLFALVLPGLDADHPQSVAFLKPLLTYGNLSF